MKEKIKLFDPYVGIEEEKAILKVIKSHFWASGAGTGNVLKFEKKFQQYVKSKTCIAVNSGTAALNLSLSLINTKNKEVILPSLTFVSTAHAVQLNGGRPIFVDVDPNTLCLDPRKIQEKITKKTIAILPVHFAGMPCNISEIKKLCLDNHLTLIEDAAHAAGASYGNKKIGQHGNFVCFSFHPVKNLSMPTGGLISINDANSTKFKKILQAKRWCGISDRINVKYDVKDIGWNYYMDEFAAAIGIEQLKKLDVANRIRKKTARRYFHEINLDNKMPFDTNCSYHFYWIRVKKRDLFRRLLEKAGIETGIHYRPVHTFTMYKNKQFLPNTEAIGSEIISLPTHPNLTNNQINYIIKTVNGLLS